MQRITVLLNPRAGAQDDAVVQRVSDTFRRAGAGEPDVRVTEGPLVRTAASEALAHGSTIVVAGGGDDTIACMCTCVPTVVNVPFRHRSSLSGTTSTS